MLALLDVLGQGVVMTCWWGGWRTTCLLL